ncbi:tagatose-bisphosphate aldolase subunit GatY [Heliorestis convoluta]|uniref:D-tagatose-bisphosphate aldolase class II n=1 Tax=Heliorestis convoluta TaxID=356322 RepID=A0A5Q2MYL4_9FIRM|nr:tagatose-bisphosphate aldolase subunit GatY [Heliorestis convoluta]QGG46236.1 Class II aldolase, tagatose bisphosphate family [Heliorestis convoluta]
MLLSTKHMLHQAQKKGYAVPAFNIHNLETALAVVQGAEAMQSPVILAATPGTLSFNGRPYITAIIKELAQQSKVPVTFHLDHHESFEDIRPSVDIGCRSVMIDASHDPFEENVRKVQEVVHYVQALGGTVEAELGRLGGMEEHISVKENEATLTDPLSAKEFVERTSIDSLAVAIGTAHGLYKAEPKLDFERLKAIRALVEVPLVLHGASGVPDQAIIRAVELGICKVNIATELKIPFTEALRDYLKAHPQESDPRKYFLPAKNAIQQVVQEKILLCGSQGKA